MTTTSNQPAATEHQLLTCAFCGENEITVAINFAIVEQPGAGLVAKPVCASCKVSRLGPDQQVYDIAAAIRRVAHCDAILDAQAKMEDIFAELTPRNVPGVHSDDASFHCHVEGCRMSAATADETHGVVVYGRSEQRPKLYGFWLSVTMPNGKTERRVFAACFLHAKAAAIVSERRGKKSRVVFYPLSRAGMQARQPEAKKAEGTATCRACDSVSGLPSHLVRDVPVFNEELVTCREDGARVLSETRGPYEDLLAAHGDKDVRDMTREEREAAKANAKACRLHGPRARALGLFRFKVVETMKKNGWWLVNETPQTSAKEDDAPAADDGKETCPSCQRRVERLFDTATGEGLCGRCKKRRKSASSRAKRDAERADRSTRDRENMPKGKNPPAEQYRHKKK